MIGSEKRILELFRRKKNRGSAICKNSTVKTIYKNQTSDITVLQKSMFWVKTQIQRKNSKSKKSADQSVNYN